jgi:hypothetical protein
VETETVEMLERCALANDAAIGESTFGEGPAVFVGKREVAHVDAPSTLDVRLTKKAIRERRAELQGDDRVTLRPNQSDWLEFTVGCEGDLVAAEALVAAAIESNRPAAPPGLPPAGAELERRRRFH